MNNIFDYLPENSSLQTLIILSFLLLASWISNFIVKVILLRVLRRALGVAGFEMDNKWSRFPVIPRLANIVPALVIMAGINFVPNLPEVVITIVQNVATAFIILTICLSLSALLDVLIVWYNRRPDAHNKPIKGYIQLVKLVLFILTFILVISALLDKSPVILLSGVGALAAVLMLVFQDTLLSLVASVQISSSDMVRVGDWIEMPQLNADGDVVDIALHTVKVQNWDKTVTTLPIRRLITDPFKNWRGMHESGGRRIKRAIYLDQNSIHFLTEEERAHLGEFALLKDYLGRKEKEIAEWNAQHGVLQGTSVNGRRITNIGTFRAYAEQYLRHHPMVHQSMTLLVRQLAPGAEGLPLEIYCFVNDTKWAIYEGVQSDIFDHIYSILPEFGLVAFQNPSGIDFRNLKTN